MRGNLVKIRTLAAAAGWQEIAHQENISLVSFIRDGARVNVYYSRMTVGTCLTHPKQGDTQLFRKWVDYKTLEKIFENPRVHTGDGYHRT